MFNNTYIFINLVSNMRKSIKGSTWRGTFCENRDCEPGEVFANALKLQETEMKTKNKLDMILHESGTSNLYEITEFPYTNLVDKYSGKRMKTLDVFDSPSEGINSQDIDDLKILVGNSERKLRSYLKLVQGYDKAIKNRKDNDPDIFEPILGWHNIIGTDMIMSITNDPVDLALKSTGRNWDQQSTERITGESEGIWGCVDININT